MHISLRSDSSVIARVLFQSVFLVAGGYGLYRGATSYLGGTSLTSLEVLVPLLVGGVFTVVAGRLLIKVFRGDTEEGSPSPPEEPPRSVRVAGDLTNKQEADWITDRLVQAAEREASFQ
jgi:hypothetical protein